MVASVGNRPLGVFDAMLFDLDGVITSTATLHAAVWKRLFDEFLEAWSLEHEVPFEPFDVATDYVHYVDGRPRYEGVASFLRSRGIELPYGSPDDPPDAPTCCGLGNRKNSYFGDQLEERGVEVFTDTVELIDALRGSGKKLAVVSASRNCEAVLSRAGLLDRFDARITGVEAGQLGLAGKPAPDTFLKAAELLGVDPGLSVVFEDAISGVQAGRAGRFGLVVGVDRRGDPGTLAVNGADVVVSDLTWLLPVEREPTSAGPAVPARFADMSFEAVVVHLPAKAALDDLTPMHMSFEQLRDAGIEVLVVSDAAAESGLTPCPEGHAATCVDELLSRLDERGIGPGLVLAIGWIAGLALPSRAARVHLVSVAPVQPAPGELPSGTVWLGGGVLGLMDALDDQVGRRRSRRTPWIDEDPRWTLVVKGDRPSRRRIHQSLLTIGDGSFGTRGAREEEGPGTLPRVLAGGVFDETAQPPALLEGPLWTSLHLVGSLDPGRDRRWLDLRSGVLVREQPGQDVPLRTFRFASLARPGIMAMRAEGWVERLYPGPPLRAPAGDGTFLRHQREASARAQTTSDRGGAISAAAHHVVHTGGGRRSVERVAGYVSDPGGASRTDEAAALLAEAESAGFERLLAEQRSAWAARWRDAEISIDGDPQLDFAGRFGLFQLMASVPTSGEAAVGPRGLSGVGYGGHVFWDADVFVLPFFAATCPPAARAMLEYRIRRLPAARRAAAERGLDGARFPWESALEGTDITPTSGRSSHGTLVPIRTGEHEEHITADVAWAALHYANWTGDDLLAGEGKALMLDTARYWASRVRVDRSGAHIYGVIGPDEFHEPVDDNAFTNVMARWNLLRAAELAERTGGAPADEVTRWRSVAGALVSGYDPATGLYEEFAGYYGLESLVISDLAETPVAADLLFGRERIAGSQVVKQPDVLMLHHLVPEETAPGSLVPNLDYYEPRCAHGSSLSPAIHASLLARAGRADDALRLFRMACMLDLEDATGTTAGGLHMATFGGVWQALVFGFAGIRAAGGPLSIDPRLPSAWRELSLRLMYRGRRIGVRFGHDALEVIPDGPLAVAVPGAGVVDVTAAGGRWRCGDNGWEVAT